MSSYSWKQRAEDLVDEEREYLSTWNRHSEDAVRNRCYEAVWEATDNACIYYSHCAQHIEELENEWGAHYEDFGNEFKAEDWREAQQHYAFHLVRACLESEVEQYIDYLIEEGILCDAGEL